MTQQKIEPWQFPYFVALDKGDPKPNAIKGFKTEADAIVDAEDRNERAKAMGLKARYGSFVGTSAAPESE